MSNKTKFIILAVSAALVIALNLAMGSYVGAFAVGAYYLGILFGKWFWHGVGNE